MRRIRLRLPQGSGRRPLSRYQQRSRTCSCAKWNWNPGLIPEHDTSSPINQDVERSRNGHRSRTGLVCGRSRKWTKICGVQKEVVCLRIESHGFGTDLGLDGLDFTEFVRGIFVEYMDHTLARRGEDQPCFRLIGGSIHTRRNRERLLHIQVKVVKPAATTHTASWARFGVLHHQ